METVAHVYMVMVCRECGIVNSCGFGVRCGRCLPLALSSIFFSCLFFFCQHTRAEGRRYNYCFSFRSDRCEQRPSFCATFARHWFCDDKTNISPSVRAPREGIENNRTRGQEKVATTVKRKMKVIKKLNTVKKTAQKDTRNGLGQKL